MAWIKRNLYFVISMVAGLILTGYCGYLFATDLKKNGAVNREYQADVARLKLLQSKPLFPSEANIARAKDDRSRLEAFRDEVRTNFANFPPPPKEDEKGFSTYLEDTIAGLKAKAADDAVVLPDNFAFAFTDQRFKLKYPAECIQPWMQQLTEIKALCDILFSAKINSLTNFRRAAVSSNDVFSTAADFHAARILTTPMATITPYKIEFRGFTRELTGVLNALAKSSNCYIINNIIVKPAGPREGEQNQAATDQPPAPPPPVTPVTPAPPPRRGTPAPGSRRGTGTTPGQSPGTTPGTPNGRGARGRRGGAAAGMGGMEGMAGLEPAAPILAAVPAPPSPPMPPVPPTPPAAGAAPATPAGGKPPAAAPAAGASAPASSGTFAPGTVLREQLLMIMISVEVVKFN
jgi:hypothetical protein